MISRSFLFIVVFAVMFTSAGCGIRSRFYAVDRPRVDQANMGNAGYIGGEKKDGSSIAERSTRRIYVFEFDKKKKLKVPKEASKTTDASLPKVTEPAKTSERGITLPYIGNDEPAVNAVSAKEASGAVAGMPYTVVKDDTLQKIAKKVYGSYGKWTKIYDANKDKIKNPNFVKPGTVIMIPSIN